MSLLSSDELSIVNERIDQLITSLDISFTRKDITENTFDAIPILCTQLSSAPAGELTLRRNISDLLLYLPDICQPKELFIALLDQADTFKEDAVFLSLLEPIKKCIQRLPSKRHLSLATAMETLSAHLISQPLPEESTDCVEYLPISCGKLFTNIAAVLHGFLDFVETFANEVSWKRIPRPVGRHADEYRQITDLTRQLVKILGKPLAVININETMVKLDGQLLVKNECRERAVRCLKLLVEMHPDVVKFLVDILEENADIERRRVDAEAKRLKSSRVSKLNDAADDNDDDLLDVEETFSELGLAVIAGLVFGEHIFADGVPLVFEPRFLLEFNLRFALLLLKSDHSVTVHRGVVLCATLLQKLPSASLDANFFDWDQMRQVADAILTVTSCSRVKEVCQSAVRLLSSLLKSFSPEGRRRMLGYLLDSSRTGSIQGYAIFLLKDEINHFLRTAAGLFSDLPVSHLLPQVFRVPEGGFHGRLLMQQNDWVMGALNLLRYLIISDPVTVNRTGIWDMVKEIRDGFLQQVRVSIHRTRSDINIEMKDIDAKAGENVHGDVGGECGCKMELNIGSESFGDLSVDEQREALRSSLVSLDMMECVLCRVEELIDQSFDKRLA